MPRLAANLSMLYPELGFLERFEAAARDGFQAVECLFPYAFEPRELVARLRGNGLQQVLINAPPGDWAGGERGLACLPGREAEFRSGVLQALDFAGALDCPRVHVLAGVMPPGSNRAELLARYRSNLAWAAQQAALRGLQVLIEPINPRDMPGYLLSRQDDAHAIVAALGEPALRVQMDLYHCQIVEGDAVAQLRRHLPGGRIAHIQLAGVPLRHEPDLGELAWQQAFAVLDEQGYEGWVGCEYRPAAGLRSGGTRAGLGWARPYLAAR